MSTFWIATVIMLLGGVFSFWWARDTAEGTSVAPFSGCLIIIVGIGSLGVAMKSLGTVPMNFLWRMTFLLIPCFVAGLLYRYAMAAIIAQAFDAFLFSYANVKDERKIHGIAQKLASEEAYPEAVLEYKRAISENPDDIDALFGLAEVYIMMEDYDKATEQYEVLLTLQEKLEMEQHCLIMNRLADLNLTKRDDVERGRYWLEQIIHTHPESKYATFAQQRLQKLNTDAPVGEKGSPGDV